MIRFVQIRLLECAIIELRERMVGRCEVVMFKGLWLVERVWDL